MRKMMNKVTGNMKAAARKAALLMKDTRGENYVDTAVKILIAVVLGALLLAGLYTLFGDVVMPTLTQRIQEMFNYAVRRIFKVPDKIDIKSINKDVCKIFNCLYHQTDTAKRKRRK